MRCFVTGIGGFAGLHLADALLAAGHDVTGTVTSTESRAPLAELAARHPRFAPDRLVALDVTDRAAVERAVASAAPEHVFHLAAVAFSPDAQRDPARAFAVNVLGTVNVLDAVRAVAASARVVIAGSSEAYGASGEHALPVVETTPLRPVNVYGVTKAAADMAAYERWWSTEAAVIRARAFNHTGPGQRPDFVCSDFARQIARMEAGLAAPVLRVGNLRAARDFSDVRDVVRGYALLAEKGVPGEAYNLCSGALTTIADVVAMLCAESTVAVTCTEERHRVRRHEVPALVGNAARAVALGWAASVPLRQTLRDLLHYWRDRVVKDAKA